MRQELNGVKTAIDALGAQVGAQVGALRAEFSAMRTEFSGKFTDMQTQFDAMKTDFSELKTQVRNTAIIVAGHTEYFARIEKKLAKLDEFDGLKNSLDVLVSEIIVSRSERTLRDKNFSDQQTMLTDHELRLTRIELRGKQS